MGALAIKKIPELILRKKASKVYTVGSSEKDELARMAETMYLNQGIGLAALQVGIDKQLAVIDAGEGLLKMVNPIIGKKEGSEVNEEGCLSIPGVIVKVKRAKKIAVSFLNEMGEVIQLKAEGLPARAIQHEIDHLSGILIIDYLNPLKKVLLNSSLKHKAGRKIREN